MDHNSLAHVFSASLDRYFPRGTRHLDLLSQSTGDIVHIDGPNSLVRGAPSRIYNNRSSTSPTVLHAVAVVAQQNDAESNQLCSYPSMKFAHPLLLPCDSIIHWNIPTGELRTPRLM
ncbi:hypothetical protein PHET_11889 [Paragonimus heterotremus]|uniref:Uncharacterized protein n=1 Tax=Paragonimus heterotremus TaxID=100268 RepID=A0A8J4SJX0_9TREM|nr:hypothetical protein PHET_11889 [Paragonimus heterotremus]